MIEKGALKGIKILDLSRMLPGPYCSMILADHGADVIAIEDKRFQEDGLFFNDLNRNKRHMSLNLKTEAGLAVFYKLAETADVILEGFRPGVVKRLGVDYESISRINRKIIYCSISGYGQNGPLMNRPGHDVNYISEAGLLDLIGDKNSPPSIPGVQIGDIAGGSMNAAVGILLALYWREKSGEGQYIDISMTDGLLGLLSLPYFFSQKSGQPPRRGNEQLSHRFACYNTYQTKDGRYISIGAVEHRFWKNLCTVLLLEEYIPLQYDEGRRENIIATFRNLFVTKNLREWQEQLEGLDVCFSTVKTMEEVFHDPLFRAREMVHRYTDEEGQEKNGFGIPVKMSRTSGSIRSRPTKFGDDTEEILLQSGYSRDEIKAFMQQNVV